jgi:hypothetical protein
MQDGQDKLPVPTSGVAGWAEDLDDLVRMMNTHFPKTDKIYLQEKPLLPNIFVCGHGPVATIIVPSGCVMRDVQSRLYDYLDCGSTADGHLLTRIRPRHLFHCFRF